MQRELAAAALPVEPQLIGVNQIGHEVPDYNGEGRICSGRDIPFLEETADLDVWALWDVRYRDIIIVDEENRLVDVYNVTDNDLAVPANYEALRDIVAVAAGGAALGPSDAGGDGGSPGTE